MRFLPFDVDGERLNIADYLVRAFTECDKLLESNIRTDYNQQVNQDNNYKIMFAYFHVMKGVDFRCLWGNDSIAEVRKATQSARRLISQYVNIDGDTVSGFFAGTQKYTDILEMSYCFAILNIAYDFNILFNELEYSLDWRNQKVHEQALAEVLKKYEEKYKYWMNFSDRFGANKEIVQAYIIRRYLDILTVCQPIYSLLKKMYKKAGKPILLSMSRNLIRKILIYKIISKTIQKNLKYNINKFP